jgi:hypothetical protein
MSAPHPYDCIAKRSREAGNCIYRIQRGTSVLGQKNSMLRGSKNYCVGFIKRHMTTLSVIRQRGQSKPRYSLRVTTVAMFFRKGPSQNGMHVLVVFLR